MDMGSVERNIAKQAIRFGNPIPKRIAESPELKNGLGLYLTSFFELDTERSHGFSLTRIPWSSIATYAAYYDFDEEQTENLFYYIRQMDNENLKRLEKKGG